MIAVATSESAVESRTIESERIALSVVWPRSEATHAPPMLIINNPLNAIFEKGISWEDVEWQ